MRLKCIKKCNNFTANNYYDVIEYSYDNYYIVLDNDKKAHRINIDFAVDYFTEV